jgi:hypothetical protein
MTSRRYDTGRPPRPPQQNDAPQGPPRHRGRRWTKRAGHRPAEEGRTAERETLPGGKARGHVDTRDLDQFLEGWVDDAPEAEETAEAEEESDADTDGDGGE